MKDYESVQAASTLFTSRSLEINLPGKKNIRLHRSLTIKEFVCAFGKYKRVMCRVFPQRSEELDCYLANILQIESSYGEKFYEYHKLFAAKAATALRDFKVKFDWGVKDNDILTLLAPHARPEVCRLCYAIDHGTNFCPLSSQSVERSTYPKNRPSSDRVDRRGRTRVLHDGKEVCNNYNTARGGINEGFDTMIKCTDLPTLECKNNFSARSQPLSVRELINKECEKGFLSGPNKILPFNYYRVSPLGLAVGKYSGKKRLILDLSAPHDDDDNCSINDLINDFLTIDKPDSCAERTMALMTTLFKRLNIPLAKHKVVGPCTVIEYLGIILDTEKMETRLPLDKTSRISEFIKKFLNRQSCIKRELLQLLGHLNFAMRSRFSKHFDSTVNLSVTDVEILDSYAILHLKTSKTDPFRKSVSIQLHKSDHTICPISAVQKYFAIRNGREASFCYSDPLFVKENGSALDRDFFTKSLRHVLDICGYNSSLYNGHSFIIGASTSAGSVYIQDHLIKTLNRWISYSYCRYIRISRNTIRKAQKSLALSKNI
ncbi:unnamed protein product [Mytilus edulis]|uniref:Uncharacterized protein n=1 Tax=Mytilus edulis TaxID=6550 RepID=A0A8S3V3Y3_MYTED|nr:unnamed protein product [Mytilus edulis]